MTRAEALEILGLDSDASLDDARKAYRALAKTYHPDKSSASNATVMFRIISNA
jgi:molecular chaperone DnaJ